jgi:hypothetical protein
MTTDLHDAEAPEHVATILRNAALRYFEAESDLAAAWGDPNAGKVWTRIGRLLEKTADKIEGFAP